MLFYHIEVLVLTLLLLLRTIATGYMLQAKVRGRLTDLFSP